ncbi:shikimate kinase [Pseudokineococcus marinus]|uniref:Shikimate kinase n=1 Tax=Pseudokineococcus marinus TaxID=351215 RepID=A0A849BUW6_9ACTN|nr:shikimate kinase [Pseudokineococcus marinus]NNH24592.1 shikimate kinase [Pseudokineococcus marinus]
MIVLVGFLGAGKTTVGRLLAERLDLPFRDADEVVVERAGRTVAEVFATDGEAAFRALEHEVVTDLLRGDDAVVSLGGGAVEHPGTAAALRGLPTARPGAHVVHLEVSLAEARARVGDDRGRPMLARPDLDAVHARRLPGFADVATAEVATAGRTPAEVADAVTTALAATSA